MNVEVNDYSLMIPSMPKPLLDIIIPAHDKPDWIDLSVRAVEHHTKHPFRLIIVDGASQESKTHMLLKDIESRGHLVLRLAQNKSFSNAINAGIEAGDAKNIVILNDDAIVLEGWDSAIIQDLADKRVGMTGARSNFATGYQGSHQHLIGVGEPPYLVFVCVAMRRQVYDEVGPLDGETFDSFSCEDIDYSWRIQQKGYQLKVSDAYVLHAGSRTLNDVCGIENVARHNAKYIVRLEQKWGKEFVREHGRMDKRVLISSFHYTDYSAPVQFMASLLTLKRADGVGFQYYQHKRTPIAFARHIVSEYALKENYDWLIMIDDDATFPPDLVRRLLSHNKDVVAALAYQRLPNHGTVAYEFSPEANGPVHLEGIEHTGLRKVDGTGLHCAAIKTSVFSQMKARGMERWYGGFDNQFGEDFAFCAHMQELGISVYVDADLVIGHVGDPRIVDEAYKKAYEAGKKAGIEKPLIVAAG